MSQTVKQALAAANFTSDGEIYTLLKMPANAVIPAAGIIAEMNTPFSTLILDKHELTLLVLKDAISDFEKRLRDSTIYEQDYQLITIDVELDPQMVGFMARISGVLADAGISFMAYAAYSRDHIFVPVEQFDDAIDALKHLQTDVK